MNFKIEQRDRATIFRPNEKRLDSVIASALKAEFLILAQPDVQTLVLDLSAVEYIDSAGLSALLLAQRQQVHHNGDMRISGASDEVRSLLSLTALDRVFPMYETVDEALAAPQLSLISVPPGDVSSTTQALKTGMKMAGASIGVAAIADLMMSDDIVALGDEEDAFDDDDEYADDIEEGDELIDDDDDDLDDDEEEDDLTEEVVPGEEELDENPSDDEIEEIEEDDLIEAEDLDLLDDEDDEDDDLL